VFGERWTLLIMRELGMSHRFDDIQAQTGMSPHLLSTRLKELEEAGIVERRLYQEKPKRYEYYKTRKGQELDSVLVAIRAWSLKWSDYGDSLGASVMTHRETGKVVGKELEILGLPGIFTLESVDIVPTEEYVIERRKRRDAFQKMKRRGGAETAAA
jgi:DNA-binding HxlR family transcriptional regulator